MVWYFLINGEEKKRVREIERELEKPLPYEKREPPTPESAAKELEMFQKATTAIGHRRREVKD